MENLNKIALASLLVLGMAASSTAQVSANATVLWSGIVPATNPTDALIIAGLAGDDTELNGTITPSSDGV